MMKKVLFISNIISPYRTPFFNALNKICDLKVIYVAENEKNRSWDTNKNEIEYNYEVLNGINFRLGTARTIHINYGWRKIIKSFNPSLVVLGTDLLSTIISPAILLYCKIKNIKIIRFEGTHFAIVKSHQEFFYKFIFKYFDGFFVYSVLTKNYLIQKYNIKSNLIDVGYNVGDSSLFTNENFEKVDRKKIKFIFIGTLNKNKNTLNILEVFKNNFDRKNIEIQIAGDGPLMNEVKKIKNSFKNLNLNILGFIQKKKLLEKIQCSDILLHISKSDRASIVVSEALFSGLFVIGSEFDGSAHNFINNKINGIIVNPYDKNEIKKAIDWSLNNINKINKKEIASSMKQFYVESYANRLINSKND